MFWQGTGPAGRCGLEAQGVPASLGSTGGLDLRVLPGQLWLVLTGLTDMFGRGEASTDRGSAGPVESSVSLCEGMTYLSAKARGGACR